MKRFRLWAIPAAVAAVVLAGTVFAGERGVKEYEDGARYEGELRDGEPHGQGVKTWPDGERHEGEFRDGQLYEGVLTLPDGERWEGKIVRVETLLFGEGSVSHGVGVKTLPDGTVVRGVFARGELTKRLGWVEWLLRR